MVRKYSKKMSLNFMIIDIFTEINIFFQKKKKNQNVANTECSIFLFFFFLLFDFLIRKIYTVIHFDYIFLLQFEMIFFYTIFLLVKKIRRRKKKEILFDHLVAIFIVLLCACDTTR